MGHCRKRGSCEADGSISGGEGGFERPFKKQRFAAEGEVEVQAWAGTSPVATNETEALSGSVPVSAAPPTGAAPASPGLLHTTAPAIWRGERQARCEQYLLAAKEGLARARRIIEDIKARLDLPANSATVAEVPAREPVTHKDSPSPDATPADVPMAVHNLAGSGGGSVSWLAGLSAFQGGSGVPRATDWDESQQGLQGVPQLQGSRPPSPPPASPTQPIPDRNPQPIPDRNPEPTPDPAALFQRQAVPLGVQPRGKALEVEAAGTAHQQSSPASQADGGGSHASISSGGSGDPCASDNASNGCSSGGSGRGSGRSGRTDKYSSGGSQSGSGAAVQSALSLPAFAADGGSPVAKPSPESGHDDEAGKASGDGGRGVNQQEGAVGHSSGAAAPTLSATEIASGVLAPDSDFSRYYAKWQVLQALKHRAISTAGVQGGGVRKTAAKGIGVKRRVGKGGEAGRIAGQHVPGSTNCNAKEEDNAFLAGMGLHVAVEEGAAAGSRGGQGLETLDKAATTAPANTGAARCIVNQECTDPMADADMEEDEWDYSFPGTEKEPGWRGTIAPHQLTPPDEAPLVAQSAAPTGSTRAGTAPTAAPSLHAAPPVQAAVPFSRPRRDPPSPASTAQPAPHGPVQRGLPFSRPRRDPPPPPRFQAVAPLSGGCDVQAGPGQQPHRKRRREGTPQAPNRRRLPDSRGDYAQQGTVGGVSIAFGAHGGLQAAAQAVAGSSAPAQSAAVASGGAAPAQAGLREALQSTGLADAAVSGTISSPNAIRFEASSFGSSQVQDAVKGSAAGVKSLYKFSF
ncbi:hypothetical protein ABBQ32_011020 [Trebouxia sp. C0010 RCD-2024]